MPEHKAINKRATKAADRPEVNFGAIAAPILGHIQFVDLHLVATNSLRHPKFDRAKGIDVPLQPEHGMEVHFDPKSGTVVAMVRLAVRAGTGRNKLMEIDAIYRLVYQIKPSFMGDYVAERAEAFCRAHSLAHVWPYWRELLSSMCMRMQLPQILAPLLLVGSPGTRVPPANVKKPKSK